jgi:hypothetical protein
MFGKGGAIALVMEAPDRAALHRFVLRQAADRGALDEIGHGVEPLDRKPAETVDDDPFGGRGAAGHGVESREKARQKGNKGNCSANSLLPLYCHSSYR